MFVSSIIQVQLHHWEMSFIISLLALMPNDCILDATSFPILPSPTIPSTLPYSSAPMNCKIRKQNDDLRLGNPKLHRFKCHIWLATTDWTMEPTRRQWLLCVPTAQTVAQTAHAGKLKCLLTFLRSQLPCFIDIAAWGTFLKWEWHIEGNSTLLLYN